MTDHYVINLKVTRNMTDQAIRLFITSGRGRKKLLFDGYMYLKNGNGAGNKIYWDCKR